MHRWKFSVLAAAAVALTGFYADDASALALGRITVQSALGEPLRAEIDLPQITPEEADTLRATTASPEVFRAQGLEFNPAVNNLRVQLQRRANGTAVLRLSSDRPVNDPFVDLVLDASWRSGHIVRSYTMLFDPPASRRAAPAVTASPQVSAPVAQAQAQAGSAPISPRVAAPSAPRAPRSTAVATPRPAPANAVTVRAGDTAGRLANNYRPASVSLDQMLVALMRANPDAFIQGNVNRIKAGAVLQMPDEATALATPPAEARQVLAAQSRDFNAFRRKLAAAAPTAEVAAAERSASGTVQARVEDKKPATAAPDKLTLSKGAITGQKAAEDQLAKDKQASESSARIAELSKNINELNQLSAASAPVGAPATAASSALGAVAVATPAAVSTQPTASEPAALATSAAASAPVAAEAAASDPAAVAAQAAAPASAPAPAPVPKPASMPAPVPEPSFLSGLMEDPLVPAGGLLALIALGGYGAYRVVQRRRANAGVDSSFLESRLQPDSFFGASGGQQVDTANSQMTTGSSMAYSPSQLDAGGDVDPVAEADVYLAYGRDLQAEEILKEAIRHNPARVSVHVKLAEIYAKRQDRKALEAVAGDVFKLTQGEGPDWTRVTELGRDLDQENPLYQPGGRPGATPGIATASASPASVASTAMATAPAAAAAALPPDLDLDLDLDLPEDALTEAPAAAGGFAAAAAAATATDEGDTESAALPQLDLPTSLSAMQPALAPASVIAPPPMADLDFPATDDLTMLPSGAMPLMASAKADTPDTAPMEFDLGDLTLDLGAPSKPATPPEAAAAPAAAADDGVDAAADDPLATKLALAQEFNAIGDIDGARTLVEEVVAESSGALKARAQRLLADLG
ncbi:FimV/HubP family polar landmark protein [Acidovorax carolinensis]|uniref:FimV/HubP family polar landmark protein n=1 Tax=Acidovorax carolinensis TaxID=553814 RepID=UPI00194FB453|nr:FimV/HubP family polar landmark protein [Acidovorax carolinensis]